MPPTADHTQPARTDSRIKRRLAAASHLQALTLFGDLGELAARPSTPRADEHHTQALAIARDLGAPPEEARALEGLGYCHLAHLERNADLFRAHLPA